MRFLFSLIFLIIFQFSFSQQKIKIIDKPIIYNEKRIKLSVEYLKERHGIIQDTPIINPKIIVLHYTGGGTLTTNFNYFNKVEIENTRKINKNQSKLNVSAHFLVDRDGTIYRLTDENLFARHTIGLNYCSIGVENIGSEKNPLTHQQVIANIMLVNYLCKKFKIEYLIGHSEYAVFKNSLLWKETNPNYFTHKLDPGNDFMKKVREGLKDLNLKSKP